MVVIAGILGYAFIANFNDNFKSYFQTNILYFYGTNNEVWSVDTQVDNIQKSVSNFDLDTVYFCYLLH